MRHAISRRKKLKKWVEEREYQLIKEYKDEPLEVGWKDIVAMIIAAFQVMGPLIIMAALIITAVFMMFSLMMS